jgi:hypothetical protein
MRLVQVSQHIQFETAATFLIDFWNLYKNLVHRQSQDSRNSCAHVMGSTCILEHVEEPWVTL